MKSIKKTVEELRPIDDTFMQKLAEDKAFCEEMLQVVMEKPSLRVITNIPQRNLHNIDTRSVTVDVLCEDEDGSQFSVEVQRADDDNHQKRVRYNSACVHVRMLEKGTKFQDLPDVYMIYITEKDFLKKGKAIYHVHRIIRETNEIIENGYHEIYVNAEIDDGTTLAEYMKILKSTNIENDERFPHICNAVKYFKVGKGKSDVCRVVDEYAEEKSREMAKEIAKALICDGVSDLIIHNATKLPMETIANLRRECERDKT